MKSVSAGTVVVAIVKLDVSGAVIVNDQIIIIMTRYKPDLDIPGESCEQLTGGVRKYG